MKKIEAVIRPERIDQVKDALSAVGVRGLTVTEVIGSGNQKGKAHTYRGTEYSLDLLPKIRIEVIAADRTSNGSSTPCARRRRPAKWATARSLSPRSRK